MSAELTLPKGWVATIVGDICREIQYGYTASASNEPCGPRFLRITDIQDGQVVWPSVPHCSISSDDTAKFALRSGDIVFARTGGTVGKSFLIGRVPETSVFASYLIRLTASQGIDPQYLYHFFQSLSYWEQIGLKKGGLQGNVNATTLSSLELPLCPTNEQGRIVGRIDELFSELDKGVESLTTAREQLKAYRQSVLNRAVVGELAGSRTFPSKPLSAVVEQLGQGWSPRCLNHSAADDETWAVITTTAIQHGVFKELENKQLPENLVPRPHLAIKAGDILITRAGPRKRVGVACLVRVCRPRLMLCDKAYRVRADTRQVVPEWIELVLNSPSTLQEIEVLKTGISDSGVNLTQSRFLELEVPVPTLAEQQGVLEVVDKLTSQTTNLEAQIETTMQQSDALRQAILKRAFSGQLVAQDPADEPASVLLKRIRAERDGEGATKRRNNKNGKKEAA